MMKQKRKINKNILQQEFEPFKRTKTINGHDYVYEISQYRDPITNKIKQKSKYLGKPDSQGKPEKVREKPLVLKSILNYGDSYLFQSLINELKLDTLLKQCFPEEETNWILLLTGYKLLHQGTLDRLSSYMETSDLPNQYPVSTCLSSQQASRVLERLGEDCGERINTFFLRWIQHYPLQGDNLLFDITSFSSRAKQIEFLKYGYNRDHEQLPQINMGLLVNETLRLPLYYKLYPGSIKDISTMDNLVRELKSLTIHQITLILDRGFYSAGNLLGLLERSYDFILSLPLTAKTLYEKILVQSSELDTLSPQDLIQIEEQQYYAQTGTIPFQTDDAQMWSESEEKEESENNEGEEVGEEYSLDAEEQTLKQKSPLLEDQTSPVTQSPKSTPLHYVISLDTARREEERYRFFHRLLEAEDKLKSMDWAAMISSIQETFDKAIESSPSNHQRRTKQQEKILGQHIQRMMKRKIGASAKYFTLSIPPFSTLKEIKLLRKTEEIEKHTRFFGLMVLLSTKPMEKELLLRRYRDRDRVEKMFDAMKNELEGLPLRSHKTNTMKGNFFILFLAMILQFHLLEKMKHGNIHHQFTISDVFFELQKLKKTIWHGKDRIINEVTKTQKILLEALHIFLPKLVRS
jgi:transposase